MTAGAATSDARADAVVVGRAVRHALAELALDGAGEATALVFILLARLHRAGARISLAENAKLLATGGERVVAAVGGVRALDDGAFLRGRSDVKLPGDAH